MDIVKDRKGRTMYYVAVDCILLNKENQILLQRRKNTGWNDGMWNMVGGHIEDEESAQECIARELKEELGIDADIENMDIVHFMQYRSNRLTIQIYVHCNSWKGIPTIQPEIIDGKEVYKADKLEWFNLNNLPDQLISSAKYVLKNYMKNRPFSQLGYDNPKIKALESD